MRQVFTNDYGKEMTEHSPEETGLLAYFQTQILPGLGLHLPELPPWIKGWLLTIFS